MVHRLGSEGGARGRVHKKRQLGGARGRVHKKDSLEVPGAECTKKTAWRCQGHSAQKRQLGGARGKVHKKRQLGGATSEARNWDSAAGHSIRSRRCPVTSPTALS
eukprot:364685-Chlamydomonas_euryale.AAC.8